MYVDDRVYDVTVRFPLSYRFDPEALGNLSITNSSGMQVPLSKVTKITQRNGEGTITRMNNRRNLTVRIDLADRDEKPRISAKATAMPVAAEKKFCPVSASICVR